MRTAPAGSACRKVVSACRRLCRALASGVSGQSSVASLSRGCARSGLQARYARRAAAFRRGMTTGSPSLPLAPKPPRSVSDRRDMATTLYQRRRPAIVTPLVTGW
jgi:hypothetical protein